MSLTNKFQRWRLGLSKSAYLLLLIYDMTMVAKKHGMNETWAKARVKQLLSKYPPEVIDYGNRLVDDFYKNNYNRQQVLDYLREIDK